MTAAFLQAELSNLISDSRRKHAEIKVAAEHSLSELKAISVTSETQLSGDLSRRSQFVDPFVLACKSQNAKLASLGTAGLQRCVAAVAVPRSRIPDVLQAYEEASPLALDVQLKVLQTLPSLLQLYAADLHGQDVLGRALSISSDLSANKLPMVSKTAAATFQQLVTAVFSRVPSSPRGSGRGGDETTNSARDRGDAFAVFIDLCTLLTGERASFTRLDHLAPPTVLETLETIISSHGSQLLRDPSVTKACSEHLLPGIRTLIDESSNYGVVVRAIRIAYLFALSHTTKLVNSMEQVLRAILKFADRPATQRWKRLLSLEFFRGICSDFDALRNLFTTFDMQPGKQNIISDFMASLVRTASEDPNLIGLGRQTTIPTTKNSDSGSEVVGAAEVALSAVTQTSSAATGISLEWSTLNTPCLESYDRSIPLETPETYVYTLVLSCVSACADGLSKFIMPLSMPNRKASKTEENDGETSTPDDIERRSSIKDASSTLRYQQLLNPLSKTNLSKREAVENCAKMIESCWPAILAICSTFLNAALDSYFYHILIRTVQKLTQVSGVLELFTPRDALLTTLAKVSLPANITSLMNGIYGTRTALLTAQGFQQNDDADTIKSPVSSTPRASVDLSSQSLNVRNLLCLRALLNLGIALGPTLSQAAWLIILQSLEQVEALISAGPDARLLQSSTSSIDSSTAGQANNLGSELAALDTARRRMVESTGTYSNAAFRTICQALLQIVADILPFHETQVLEDGALRPGLGPHRSTRSVSGNWAKAATLEVEVDFVLKTLGRIASVNLHRFREAESEDVSWGVIVLYLSRLEKNNQMLPNLRLQCARIVDAIAVEASIYRDNNNNNESHKDAECIIAVKHGLPALGQQIQILQNESARGTGHSELAAKIVSMLLEALQNIIGTCGERLGDGWSGVFKIVHEVVECLDDNGTNETTRTLYGQAFKPIQLILSDFLPVIDDKSLESVVNQLKNFATQKVDLNMALTASALYWNVASLLLRHTRDLNLEIDRDKSSHDTPVNLWSQIMLGLYELCTDNQSDVRNAALRMLNRILQASVSKLSSTTLLSCLSQIWLPLVLHFGQVFRSDEEAWQLSISTILNDVQQIVEQHGRLLLDSPRFIQFWCQMVKTFETLLKLKTVVLSTQVFQTLTSVLSNLRQSAQLGAFYSSDEAVETLWFVWVENHPADLQTSSPNETAFSAYAALLAEIAKWRLDYLSKSDRFADKIAQAIRRSTSAARHDQYTMDIKRVSLSQEKCLKMVEILFKISFKHDYPVEELLIELVDDIIKITANHNQESSSKAERTKMPTNIAFANASIEILRREARPEVRQNAILDTDLTLHALNLCTSIVKTRYSTLPSDLEHPLWQSACSYGIECVSNLRGALLTGRSEQVVDPDRVAERLIDLNEAILLAPNLDVGSTAGKELERLERDEGFEIAQLNSLHAATIKIFYNLEISGKLLKRHMMLLFRQSLVAQPWYNDLNRNLENKPLIHLSTVRRGSIRLPILPVRRKIYEEALHSLFDVVDRRHPLSRGSEASAIPMIAQLAAPYVLLRVAHTLKTFIADQPLRNLEPPVIELQRELYVVLNYFVQLRVNDRAFEEAAREFSGGSTSQGAESESFAKEHANSILRNDGKSHLRILFRLAQKFEQVWYKIPRLDVRECSWQAQENGKGVERCLQEWKDLISEGWGPKF